MIVKGGGGLSYYLTPTFAVPEEEKVFKRGGGAVCMAYA